MHIGLICPYDLERPGGVQEHVLAQAAELRHRGHIVKVITPRPRGFKNHPPKDLIFVGNSAVVKTPIKTSLELGVSFGRDTLDDMLAEQHFDLLHIHEPEVPILGAQLLAKATCPVVATFHAIHPETPMARTIETFRIPYSRSIFSRITAMTAVSDAAATFVIERTDRDVTIIPNGIDLSKYKFVDKKPAKKRKTILYVGRLEKRKGVAYLLKAYRMLCQERGDVELIIAGDGELRESLEKYVEDHDLPNVKFLGFVSEKKKLKLLNEADLFCSPALYGESFGIVLLEAMASGTVIVAGNNPGYTGVLQGTGQISLISPKVTKDFAARLEMLLDDEALCKTWLKWAKGYVAQFDYPKVVDQYEKLYTKVLKETSK